MPLSCKSGPPPLLSPGLTLWRIFLAAVIWTIWKEINHHSFEGKKKNFVQIIRTSQMVLVRWGSVELLIFRKQKPSRSAFWVRPPSGWLNLSVDSSLRPQEGLAGYGDMLCNSNGEVLW
ncbi:hypothetical protein AMTRI_Chr05g69230 [Amborella trichopoda]